MLNVIQSTAWIQEENVNLMEKIKTVYNVKMEEDVINVNLVCVFRKMVYASYVDQDKQKKK